MKTYKLITIAAGKRSSEYAETKAKGIVEAERKADELLEKCIHDYPSDTYIICVEDVSEIFYTQYLCWQRDCHGEKYWKRMENDFWGFPIGLRPLTEEEKKELNKLREEKEIQKKLESV